MEIQKSLSEIYKCHDLKLLSQMWDDKSLTDDVRIAVAYQYDRLKAHRQAEADANYDKNNNEPIKNTKYADII